MKSLKNQRSLRNLESQKSLLRNLRSLRSLINFKMPKRSKKPINPKNPKNPYAPKKPKRLEKPEPYALKRWMFGSSCTGSPHIQIADHVDDHTHVTNSTPGINKKKSACTLTAFDSPHTTSLKHKRTS